MDPVVATIVTYHRGGRRCWVARVQIPGRAVLVLPEAPSRDAAVSAVQRRWPGAEVTDQAAIGRSPSLVPWADTWRLLDVDDVVWESPEPGRGYRHGRWRRWARW